MNWRFWHSRPTVGTLSAIFVSAAAGQPMVSVPSAHALAGAGLREDRYAGGAGFWHASDACQITVLTEQDLQRARRRAPQHATALLHGSHRRNLVVAGLTMQQLRDRRIRIGQVELQWRKPRPPCGYLDQVEGSGMCKALGRNSGACFTVRVGGTLEIGARVEILEPQPSAS